MSQKTILDSSTEEHLDHLVHRLSQPVTAIQGSLEVALLQGVSAADRKEAVEIALQQADRLVKILQELRESSTVH